MASLNVFKVPYLLLCVGLAAAQYHTTTPVPILKQINRHNGDGSYSYGYEAADGSYKIESKYPTGEVYGKYGFLDDTGSLREIEYGASRRGFEPAGTDINVPPPTLKGNGIAGTREPEDDGQYREDPSIYYTDPKYTNGERYEPAPKQRYQQPALNLPRQQPAPAAYNPAPKSYSAPSAYGPRAGAPSQHRPQYQQQYQQQYQGQYRQPHFAPVASPLPQAPYQGSPTPNAGVNLGSYTVHYRR
ncbi:extensin-2 [Orussus abietinus]|uniref:extensin-2 n=1 Tax=Orussus abietinus TaxID=222816 RepID=UPI000C715ADE|nr:extensin-2 [Orussus abietinus]